MVGHLLEYHPGVRAVKQLLDDGELGRVLYLYANRLNLGKVRPDENALWSLGPHDISVINFLTGEEPEEVSARGECYLQKGVEDVVFGYIKFPSGMIGHLHVSWLDPHKTRKITVVGSDKMVVFDDMESDRKVTVYDKGAVVPRYESYGEYVSAALRRHPHPAHPQRRASAPGVRALRRLRPGGQAAAQRRPRRPQRGARAGGHAGLPARRRPAGEDGRADGDRRLRRGRLRRRLLRGGSGLPVRGRLQMKPSDLGHNLLLGENVTIGSGVTFGANVVVYDDTVIGDGCFIQDNVVLGKVPSLSPTSTAKRGELPALMLGAGSVVCTGAILYRGVTLGERCIIGDLASVRERCVLGERVVVGRGTCVENDTRIGAFTKIQSNAYITAYMEIEDHVFVAPTVQTTNDNFMGRTERRHALEKGATIRRGARVGGGSLLLPAVEIGEEAFVAAGSIVTRDVPAHKVVMGSPAKVLRDVPEDELLENQ